MKIKDFIIKIWIYLSTVTVFFIIFSIIYFVISKGIREINLSFLTENPKGMPLGSEGGIKNAIMGSVFLMFLAIFFSIILGTGCAIYSTVYCNSKKINMAIRLVIQCISSVPSIIIGLFVYGFFIVTLNVPRSMLTAGISLGIMVFPFVEIRIEKSIMNIDKKIIRESFSLGV